MTDDLWWREGVIYQIYPRSFYDTNGDGLGDLPGITAQLDYIASLGVEAIWLSPFYPSPDVDFGYDVSNHCAVDPRFGTLEDFDRLVAEAHARGIKVILDLVLNHTSNRHPWFLESRSSLDNPKRDWYIWRSLKENGKPPNNWRAMIGTPAWEKDDLTGQAYLHLFLREQPDVNWRNPQVRQAQLDIVRFWLRRGVDGFRLDIFNAYFKDEALRDNPHRFHPIPPLGVQHQFDMDQPEMIPLLQELRSILDEQAGRYAVGETAFASPQKTAAYCAPGLLHAAFSFEFTGLVGIGAGALKPEVIERKIRQREQIFNAAGVWPTTVMGNHDVPRPASRYTRDESDALLKLAMALLLTLRGTPFLYYGDEIGMRDLKLRRDQILDPIGKLYWPIVKGRDGCRGPMQWEDSANAGFSQGAPWLPIHPNFRDRNVALQQQNPVSLLNFTRTLIALRKTTPALRSGDLAFIPSGSKHILAYTRSAGGQTVLVVLNFSPRPALARFPAQDGAWRLLFSTHPDPRRDFKLENLPLLAFEVSLLAQP
jgi:alpha-glucosidase